MNDTDVRVKNDDFKPRGVKHAVTPADIAKIRADKLAALQAADENQDDNN